MRLKPMYVLAASGIVLTVAVVLSLAFCGAWWVGHKKLIIVLRVVDAANTSPVRGATVRIWDEAQMPKGIEAISNETGLVAIEDVC